MSTEEQQLAPQDLAIGVDIGGTSVKYGVVDLQTGTILKQSSFLTPREGPQSLVQALRREIQEFLSGLPTITKLGAGVPGAMNEDRSLVRFPPNLEGWKEEPLRDYLKAAFPEFTSIEVDNDAKVATLAEAKLGAGKGLDHFILVTLGTGVGGGIWSHGVFRGASGGAGEFGHLSVDYNGPHCGCGGRGCIEAYIGQRYLTQRTLHKLHESHIYSTLRDITPEELDPKAITTAAQEGDAFALSVLEEAGMLLGFAMSSAAKLLDIPVFIVGGGVARAGQLLLDPAQQTLEENLLQNQREHVRVLPAQFGNDAGMIGAALLTLG